MTSFDFGTRSDALVMSGRLFAQKLLAEEHARDGLRDAQEVPAEQRNDSVRLATERLEFEAVALDAAILDFAETIKESFRIEQREAMRSALEPISRLIA